VAKLLIFRGEVLHTEVELTGQTVRIGRSPQNDIVLEDPSKGVSRNHAEIRFEGGRCVLTDVQSENGIWVSGSRVPSVVLGPDVVASVGPFRLKLEAPATETPVPPPDAQTQVVPRLEHTAGPPPAKDARVPGKPAPRPRVPGSVKVRRWHEQPRSWVLAGTAALLIAASGFAAYKFLQQREPAVDLEAAATTSTTTIPPATALPPPPPPPPPTSEQLLDEAEALIAAKDCLPALEKTNEVLATDPNDERAKKLAKQAKDCSAPRTVKDPPAVSKDPSEGGLDLRPGERQKDYQKRVNDMRESYDSAVSRLEKRDCVQAVREFEEVKKQVPEKYLKLAELLEGARKCVTDNAQGEVSRAEEALKNDDFDGAEAAVRRAYDLDKSIQLDQWLKKIGDAKITFGRDKCTDGKLAYNYKDSARAIAAFDEVIKWLPPTEPCYATAQDALKKLRK